MNNLCHRLHQRFNSLKIYRFPFNKKEIPSDGIYILFESGEYAHGTNRIVRVGTHTGDKQLRSRLYQHFVKENKDRSIFRKNIGRTILRKSNDDFLRIWEIDLTSSEAKRKYANTVDHNKQKNIERQVTEYIQNNFSFVVFPVAEKANRLYWEAKIISTISLCSDCCPSKNWIGLYSPKAKIRESGLWLVNALYKEPLSESDYENLERLL
jgi:hypothetical protein